MSGSGEGLEVNSLGVAECDEAVMEWPEDIQQVESSSSDELAAQQPILGKSADTTEDALTTTHSHQSNLSRKWTRFVLLLRSPIKRFLNTVATHAARHPISYAAGITCFSLLLLIVGLATNFNVDTDEDVLYTPRNSRAIQHEDWIEQESGFPQNPRMLTFLVHADGANVVGEEGLRHAFETLDTVRNTTGYEELCVTYGPDSTCSVFGVTAFYNHSAPYFEEIMATPMNVFGVQLSNDDKVHLVLSTKTYPDGTTIDVKSIIGYPERDERDLLTYGLSFLFGIELPAADEPSRAFEADAIDRLLDLQDAWKADENNTFVVEFFTERSFNDEFTRAIVKDIPLVPFIFMIMGTFTAIVFWKRDWVYSRCLLGFGAVCTIGLSIATGYGLMFTIGIPFTSMTQMLPFIMFGIGLDDAFIITGAYARTDHSMDVVERLQVTIDEVGPSIAMTTITSTVAFGLGCVSSIPSVYWLCLYAFPTILIDFLYQITFFIALIVLDERRVKAKRRDVFVCCIVKSRLEEDEEEVVEIHFADRLMSWYAGRLLRPWVKAVVVVAFAALCGVLAWRASLLTRDFDFTEIVPSDSYITPFIDNLKTYTQRTGGSPEIYFRFIDQSSPAVQDEMMAYVNDLVALDEVSDPPTQFWLGDFRNFKGSSADYSSLSFEEQIQQFLEDPVYKEMYSNDIVRSVNGNVTASRTQIYMDQVDIDSVLAQVDALRNQRWVTRNQPANFGLKHWAMFTFESIYFIWEFYRVANEELIFTTILGVAAVSAIAFFLIPHWTAILFVAPMIAVLYVDLLGVLQIAGISINAVSYITLVMSIGLLVDFVIHVIVRYFESREEGRQAKTKDMLSTVGASVLLGGVSTFLGILPLAFSTSDIFYTVFVAFLGLVTLGLGHGLILFPVILSLFGPNVNVWAIEMSKKSSESDDGLVEATSSDSVEEANNDMTRCSF